MKPLNQQLIKSLIKPRDKASHKGTYGHALLIAGNTGKMGAAVIATQACLRSGVGLVTTNIPEKERFILQATTPEAMVMMRQQKINHTTSFSALGIGPGIGTDDGVLKLVAGSLKSNLPLVIDADALNVIALHKTLLHKIPKYTILTPHPKEFDRLFGIHQNNNARIITAIEKAKEYHCIIVLKTHETLITSGLQTFINKTGNAGLAKGGSGDALTGMITAFLAQGYNPLDAALMGVYIHGLAADITLQNQSMESMLITDVIKNLGKAFQQVLQS
ncbi:MAG: NAD(P)H-hydrate dehydratase [Bacteroidota bacterium]